MQTTTNGAATNGRSLPAPLGVAADMTSHWGDGDMDFDTAADRIVRAHARDGAHRDLPISDLKAWALTPNGPPPASTPALRAAADS